MSGHSKWSSIKHKKGAEDAKRGQLFSKLSRGIMVAAKEGGGNPDMNVSLANAIEKAKSYSMPKENIERAIKRGTGESGGVVFENITYEGYGVNGVAVMVDVMTDNRNRAAADVRRIFNRAGGSLGTTGSVGWMFERKGVIMVNRQTGVDEDDLLEIALEAGAEDMNAEDDQFEITTAAEGFRGVLESPAGQGDRLRFSRDHHAPQEHRPAGQGRRQEDIEADRRPGGERRRAGGLLQLRHPRRGARGALAGRVMRA